MSVLRNQHSKLVSYYPLLEQSSTVSIVTGNCKSVRSSPYKEQMVFLTKKHMFLKQPLKKKLRIKDRWGESERKFHINTLELLVALSCLKLFYKLKAEIYVMLELGNATSVPYIDKGGRGNYPKHAISWARTLGFLSKNFSENLLIN